MSEEALAAPASAAAAESVPEMDSQQRLVAYFANQEEQQQVDKSQPETEAAPDATDAANAPPADETAAEGDKPAETQDTPEEEPAADEAPVTDAEGEPDFKALEGDAREFLTDIDAFKAKYPRNVATEVVEEFVEISKIAQKGEELERRIGGEHFIEPVVQIAEALQKDDAVAVFSGIVNAPSAESFYGLLDHVMHMAFVESKEWADNPEVAGFAEVLDTIATKSLQGRFGANVTIDKLEKLAQWDELGWFEKIEEWTANKDIPYDEVTQLLEATNDPKYAELLQRAKTAESQLAAKATQDESAAVEADSKIDTAFGATVTGEIEKVLTDVIWKNSVLRDISSDTAELKEEKAYFRDRLTADAIKAFNDSDAREKLLTEYKNGRSTTAQYKKGLAEAITKAIQATEKETRLASRNIARSYGTKRNAQIMPPVDKAATQPAGLKPSTPTDFAPTEAHLDREGVKKSFEEYFRGQAANGRG